MMKKHLAFRFWFTIVSAGFLSSCGWTYDVTKNTQWQGDLARSKIWVTQQELMLQRARFSSDYALISTGPKPTSPERRVTISEVRANPKAFPEIVLITKGTRLRWDSLKRSTVVNTPSYEIQAEIISGHAKGRTVYLDYQTPSSAHQPGSLRMNREFFRPAD